MNWMTDVGLGGMLLLLVVVAVLVLRLRSIGRVAREAYWCAGPLPINGDMICPLLRQGRRLATDAPGTHPALSKSRMFVLAEGKSQAHEIIALQVEDDALTLRATEAILQTFGGCRSVSAKDGPVGLLFFARLHPDVVLFDWHITGLEGAAWLKTKTDIEQHEKWAPVPVVVLTSDESVRAEAATLGLDPALVLIKPAERKSLGVALRLALAPAISHLDEGRTDPQADS